MPNLNQAIPYGPLWPLGQIVNVTPGTPVPIMFNVDPNKKFDPTTGSDSSASRDVPATAAGLLLQPNSANTGNCYLVLAGGSKADTSTIIMTIPKTLGPFLLTISAWINQIGLSGLSIDADNAADWVQVTALIR